MKSENFSAYILAGGKSSRMGREKAFLKIDDQTFIENAFETLKPICDERIKTVLNSNQKHLTKKLPNGLPHIFDIYQNRGALGGIHSALTDCQTKYAIILACDLPFVTNKAIERLVKIILNENVAAVIPKQEDGKLQPLCAIYDVKKCLPELEVLLKKDTDFSVRDFLKLVKIKLVKQTDLSRDKRLFLNINHPSDYNELVKQLV